jgi:raffinose synthase
MYSNIQVKTSTNAKMIPDANFIKLVDSSLYTTTGKAILNNEKLSAKMKGIKRWMALSRYNTYWMKPSFGKKLSDVPEETQFLLVETANDEQIAIIPLSTDEFTFTMRGGDAADEIIFTQKYFKPVNCTKTTDVKVALFAYDDYDLLMMHDEIAKLVSEVNNYSMQPRNEKKAPDFVNKFGWCTWDAYYKDINESLIMRGVMEMIDDKVKPDYIIIDDGWLDVKGDYLNSFKPDNKKFDSGFGNIRKMLGIERIVLAVWHNLNGYWGGINPDSELASQYKLIKTENLIRPWEGEKDKKIPLYLIDPLDISRFYLDWYRNLKKMGVDMVKVDGQSGLELFTDGIYNRNLTMRSYQEAMQAAGGLFFHNNIISCMSHGNDVFSNIQTSNVVRNSDDYFPCKPAAVQQNHIFVNAMNAVYTSLFAIPDWDMFKSGSPEGDFHAAARALSGGPIYICDKPGEYDVNIIKRLRLADGTLLKPKDIALPMSNRIFIDCLHEESLLVMVNFTDNGTILGLFNVNVNGKTITESIDVSEYLPEEMEDNAVYMKAIKGTVGLIPENGVMKFKLKPMTYELLHFAEIKNGVAPLGLVDKYIGSAAICNYMRQSGTAILDIKIGGKFIIYSEKKPDYIMNGLQQIEFKYDVKHKIITINTDDFLGTDDFFDEFNFDVDDDDDDFEMDELTANRCMIQIVYKDEIKDSLLSLRGVSEFEDPDIFDIDDDFLDDEDILPQGRSLTETGFETEEDMLKMIKEVMERMEEGEPDNQPLRLLPQKKGHKRKQ